MGRNGYLMQKQRDEAGIMLMQQETTRRFMIDLITITLNDPQYMGGNAFGFDRIRRVIDGLQENYDAYFDALTVLPEADYYRAKLDEAIKRIVGDREGEFKPFEQRYEYIRKITYTKEVRHIRPKKKRKK